MPAITVLAIADSDSYLKWSAATLDRLPAGWTSAQLLIDSPVRPSPGQIRAAAGVRPVEMLRLGPLLRRIRRVRPEVVLLAATGPVVAVLAAALSGPDRPVLVTGLPGIALPASERALTSRLGCDLFLLHSRTERAAYAVLAEQVAHPPELALTTLPFLPDRVDAGDPDGPLIFAAQAIVPPAREQRQAILETLAQLSDAVIKVRATPGERQTHNEPLPYAVLAEALPAGSIRFVDGSMRQALTGARGLVTVSSTAALEAMALGVPTLLIDDFGVSDALINTVFTDSGCLGSLEDLRAGRLSRPDPRWLTAHYFHPPQSNDAVDRLTAWAERRAVSGLPARPQPPLPWWRRAGRRARLSAPSLVPVIAARRWRPRRR